MWIVPVRGGPGNHTSARSASRLPDVIGSAYWIAAARARESTRPDRLFDDPWAGDLAGERGIAMMAASERASGGENTFLPVRTRYIDDAVTAAVADGIRQVVLLGAGLDTRAYRLDLPPDLRWFEVDRPAVFATKDRVLGAEVPRCRRLAVPMEMSSGWSVGLTAAGLDVTARTAWIAEGLLFYLSAADVDAALGEAAAVSGPGSRFIADVMSADGLRQPAMEPYRRYCDAQGLPPPFGHDDPAALLTANGWQVGHLTYAGAPDANFGRIVARPDADPRSGRAHLVTGETPAG